MPPPLPSTALPSPTECANCGAEIPPRAQACPECGADERTGWREQSIYDGLDLPDPDEAEPPVRPRRPTRVNGLAWYWWVVAALLLAGLILGALGLR